MQSGGERPAWFGSGAPQTARVLARSALVLGETLLGPIIVEGPVDTTVVPPGWSCCLDAVGSLILERREGWEE